MQFEGSNLWALDEGTGIIRLDPLTGSVLQTIPGISGYYIAVDGTTAWVTDVGHSVDRIDLAAGKVVKTIDVPAAPKEMTIYDGAVWVTCDGGDSVVRIDIATNRVVATIPAGSRPANLAVGEGAVWVWNHDEQLLRIDPASDKVVARIDGVSGPLGAGVAVGGGSVWVVVPGDRPDRPGNEHRRRRHPARRGRLRRSRLVRRRALGVEHGSESRLPDRPQPLTGPHSFRISHLDQAEVESSCPGSARHSNDIVRRLSWDIDETPDTRPGSCSSRSPWVAARPRGCRRPRHRSAHLQARRRRPLHGPPPRRPCDRPRPRPAHPHPDRTMGFPLSSSTRR